MILSISACPHINSPHTQRHAARRGKISDSLTVINDICYLNLDLKLALVVKSAQ